MSGARPRLSDSVLAASIQHVQQASAIPPQPKATAPGITQQHGLDVESSM